MKKAIIFIIMVWLSVALHAQYTTPWGIGPLATSHTPENGLQSSLSVGGVFSTETHNENFSLGLQQGNLDVFISIWDTIDIENLRNYSIDQNSNFGFFLTSESLGSGSSFEVITDKQEMGIYSWNEVKNLFQFEYNPEILDFEDTIVFMAINGLDSIKTEILFSFIPDLPEEDFAMGLAKTPSHNNDLMNDVAWYSDKSDSSMEIAGRILLFDSDDLRDINLLSANLEGDQRFDTINKIRIFADTIIISRELWFPGSDVSIYARKLIFDTNLGSINTTPFKYTIEISDPEDPINDGLRAGNIHLYIGSLSMVPGFHFKLNGGEGQSVSISSDLIPGKGGNGGILESPTYISKRNYFMNAGEPGDNGPNFWGEKGKFLQADWNPGAWLHARNIQTILNYIRLQYMENNMEYVKEECENLNSIFQHKFSDTCTYAASPDEADLFNARNELSELQKRVDNHLDYFGHHVGWVPMLSFEIYKAAFETEVDHAINLMFLSYLINTADANIEQVMDGMHAVREELITEVSDLQDDLNTAVEDLSIYEADYIVVQKNDSLLREDLKSLEERLLKDAEANADKAQKIAKLKSIASLSGQILSVIPYPGCAIAGQMLTTASKLDYEDPWSLENAQELSTGAYNGYKSYKAMTKEKIGDNEKVKALTDIGSDEKENSNKSLDKWNAASGVLKDMYSAASSFDGYSSFLKVSDKEVQAQLDKLKASSDEYKNLITQIDAVIKEKQQLHMDIEYSMNRISSDLNRMSENRMAIQSLTSSMLESAGKRDLRTLQYANNIEKRSFERLQKYHYLMARAYEYRTLLPWTTPLNLEPVRNSIKEYLEDLQPDDDPVIGLDQMQIIKDVYRDQIQVIADAILSKFQSDGYASGSEAYLELTPYELDLLNQGRDLYINFSDEFLLKEENVRINKIGVIYCMLEDSTIFEGDIYNNLKSSKKSSTDDEPLFKIIMEHTGFSSIQSKGEMYYFNHNLQGQDKIQWRSKIDYKNAAREIYQETMSDNDKSLMLSFYPDLDQSKLSFSSAPSASANIKVSLEKEGPVPNIVKMKVKLNYDYTKLPDATKLLKVETQPNISPYYSYNIADGSSGLKKESFRIAFSAKKDVIINPQEVLGNYKFQYWNNATLSEIDQKSRLSVYMDKSYRYIAVYALCDSVWFKTPIEDQSFHKGENMNISWDQNIDHDMRLDLYSNGFYTCCICDSVMGRSFNWEIPQDLAIPPYNIGIFKIKISSRLDSEIFDWSEDLFYISVDVPEYAVGMKSYGMKIYPNPASQTIWLEFEDPDISGKLNYQIYSSEGKLIKSAYVDANLTGNSEAISLSELKKGLYILKVISGKTSHSKRFILE